MPSDVFWTGLFTFGGGALGAAGTYFGVRSQREVQLGQLHLEKNAQENESLEKAQENWQVGREQRRSIYLAYLAALDAVIHSPSIKDLTEEDFSSMWTTFIRRDDELELGGTEEVKDASYSLWRVVDRIADHYIEVLCDPHASWPEDADRGFEPVSKEYDDVRSAVVSAMREDIHSFDPSPAHTRHAD